MKGYYGQTAKNYQPTPANLEILLPALDRAISPASTPKTALDVGCGKADYYPLLTQKGYSYTGLDVSEDMISAAKINYPTVKFTVGSATEMQTFFTEKFDLILINMLLLHCESTNEICTILTKAANLLLPGGSVVVGIPHPCFDSYMRGKLFNQFDVSEKFTGYFSSGQKYVVNKHIGDHTMVFENFHWTLTDYMDCVKTSGLILTHLDECKPPHTLEEINKEYNINRDDYPTYLVASLQKPL